MEKRTFLKMSSFLIIGTAVSPLTGCFSPPRNKLKNWAGNIEFSTNNVHYPDTVEELIRIVKKSNKIRAIGSRHSFNRIADSKESQVSLSKMNKVISLNSQALTVTVEGGITYSELAPYLYENGFALENLASLPHITIAGAVATATHGSGVNIRNLSSAVSGIEFVNAKGGLVSMSRTKDGEKFNGAVVALGALGIVTKLTLDLVPVFDMTQVVYLDLPMKALATDMLNILSNSYSVSLFTNWSNQNIEEVWLINKAINGQNAKILPNFFGARAASKNVHPVIDQKADNVTEQMGVPGRWYERMPHFKMGFKPSTGKELQSEYFVPIEHAYRAMMAIETLHEKITPVLYITEIRTVKADDLWLSPCYQQDCIAFHFTWKQQVEVVNEVVSQIEQLLLPFKARPHWAKVYTLSPKVLQSRYPKLNDFKSLVAKWDPNGKFRNDYIQKNLYN